MHMSKSSGHERIILAAIRVSLQRAHKVWRDAYTCKQDIPVENSDYSLCNKRWVLLGCLTSLSVVTSNTSWVMCAANRHPICKPHTKLCNNVHPPVCKESSQQGV